MNSQGEIKKGLLSCYKGEKQLMDIHRCGRKWTLLLVASLFFCLSIFGGCQKNEMNKQNEDTLLIIGTTWKLVGFGDSKTDSFESAKPSGENTYLLTFNDDETVSGITSTNGAGGAYSLMNFGKLKFTHFGPATYINELFDGNRYIEAMNKVSSYRVSAGELFLYYGENTYLLFQSMEDK